MKIKPTVPSKTVLTIVTGFLVIHHFTQYTPLLSVTVLLGIGCVVSDTLAGYVDRGWMALTRLLGYIMPNVILSIVFYVFLLPIALLARWTSGQDMLKLKKTGESVYKSVNKTYTASDLEKPW